MVLLFGFKNWVVLGNGVGLQMELCSTKCQSMHVLSSP